jgi:hypothetical protein
MILALFISLMCTISENNIIKNTETVKTVWVTKNEAIICDFQWVGCEVLNLEPSIPFFYFLCITAVSNKQ